MKGMAFLIGITYMVMGMTRHEGRNAFAWMGVAPYSVKSFVCNKVKNQFLIHGF